MQGFEKLCQKGRGKRPWQGKETRAAFDETIERGKCFIGEKAEDVEAATGIRRKILRERLDTRCK